VLPTTGNAASATFTGTIVETTASGSWTLAGHLGRAESIESSKPHPEYIVVNITFRSRQPTDGEPVSETNPTDAGPGVTNAALYPWAMSR